MYYIKYKILKHIRMGMGTKRFL